jgi:hypothetical protein
VLSVQGFALQITLRGWLEISVIGWKRPETAHFAETFRLIGLAIRLQRSKKWLRFGTQRFDPLFQDSR